MITVTGKLVYGIECEGKTYYDFSVKPLTLAEELVAIGLLEADERYAEYSDTHRTITETLAYWTQQLAVTGLPQQKLTIELLMNGLNSEDYQVILNSLGTLREKSLAAGRASNSTVAEQTSGQATDEVMSATDKLA